MKTEKFNLFPPEPDKCQVCAVNHDSKQPHNKESLFYQVNFKLKHGVEPTWLDAMSHCTDEIKKLWMSELKKHNIGGFENANT